MIRGLSSRQVELADNLGAQYRAHVGSELRKLRDATGLTQREVCEKLSMSQPMYANTELGRTFLSAPYIEAVANLFGVDTRKFALFLLRYQNPYLWELITGGHAPEIHGAVLKPAFRSYQEYAKQGSNA